MKKIAPIVLVCLAVAVDAFAIGGVSGSFIKSIQHVTLTSGSNPIERVDRTKSIIAYGGFIKSAPCLECNYNFDSNTSIASSGSDARVTVIEFDQNVVESVQEVQVTIANAQTVGKATLTTPVDTSRSVLLYGGIDNDPGAASEDDAFAGCSMTDNDPAATTVYCQRAGTTGSGVVQLTVIEFKSSAVSN